jgi:two-component system, NarL family, invasion response regulator UvrY
MKRIIIADDHAVVRTGIQLILDETEDMRVCCEACNGNELVAALIQETYDLLIMDASMPGKDGIDLLYDIKKLRPAMPVVVFTMNNDDNFAIRMIKAGAAAYINKETEPNSILMALRAVLLGKKYFTPAQAELLAELVSQPNNYAQLPHETLTDREFQIMFLLASGQKNSEIADKLNVSKNTIANHRTAILKKMNMENNVELTRYAIKHGIVK